MALLSRYGAAISFSRRLNSNLNSIILYILTLYDSSDSCFFFKAPDKRGHNCKNKDEERCE